MTAPVRLTVKCPVHNVTTYGGGNHQARCAVLNQVLAHARGSGRLRATILGATGDADQLIRLGQLDPGHVVWERADEVRDVRILMSVAPLFPHLQFYVFFDI